MNLNAVCNLRDLLWSTVIRVGPLFSLAFSLTVFLPLLSPPLPLLYSGQRRRSYARRRAGIASTGPLEVQRGVPQRILHCNQELLVQCQGPQTRGQCCRSFSV